MPSSKDTEIDPTEIRKVIYSLDAYRSHIFYDITWIDEKVKNGNLGRTFAGGWKKLRARMFKMARVTLSVPGNRRIAKIQQYFEALWQIVIPLVFLFILINFMAPGIPIVAIISPYLVIVAFAALFASLGAKYFLGGLISRRINQYFVDNPEAQVLRAAELKNAIQVLIEELRKFLRDSDEDPKDHLVGVGFTDYKGIEINKKPRPWRQYYLVTVTQQ